MVVECDQTSFLATSMMLLSEEARRPFQRPVHLPLSDEAHHGNHIENLLAVDGCRDIVIAMGNKLPRPCETAYRRKLEEISHGKH